MFTIRVKSSLLAVAFLASIFFFAAQSRPQNPTRTVLLEVIRNSWDAQRNETLVYLRVYSDGFAEANPMRKVDFRNVGFEKKQLSNRELAALSSLLANPDTARLLPTYSRYWRNKDFGYKYDVTISGPIPKHLELMNFQPFLARKEGKPYPRQLEKLGCFVWKLRAEVSGEPLEKNWLKGCAALGY
ncbi:MAG TPA: hypothetical protein VGU63_05250 [Candidatus Acidoferrales bacterium]|nr:hypothetical protein [Candidatus Acidoferrales bacterium]